jgi:hypothetical protein
MGRLTDLLRPDEHLVCYDYGMGGLWGVVIAPSPDSVRELYPELHVANTLRPWMDDESLMKMREAPLWLDADPPQGLLERSQSSRAVAIPDA